MRFRRAFKECRKYPGRDCVARVHDIRLCRSLGGRDTQAVPRPNVASPATISILWPSAIVSVCVSTGGEAGVQPNVRNGSIPAVAAAVALPPLGVDGSP